MDYMELKENLSTTSENQRTLTRRYMEQRNKFGNAKYDLALLLVPYQDQKEFQKASFEKQLLMLLEDTPENRKAGVYSMYEDYIKCQQNYKGLALMIQRNSEYISWQQSLMRYAREND